MAITELTINKGDNGYDVSFKPTDGKLRKATLTESVYGTYLLNVAGTVSLYKLSGLQTVFSGGIRASEHNDLNVAFLSQDFSTDDTLSVKATGQLGMTFVAANDHIRFGQTELAEIVPDEKGSYEAVWLGEDKVTYSSVFNLAVKRALKSRSAKSFVETNNIQL